MFSQYLKLPGKFGESLHRARAILIGIALGDIGSSDNADFEKQINEILKKNPRMIPIATRYRARMALQSGRVNSPEIWLARLDEAIGKTQLYFMPSERWRLMALKLMFLKMADEANEYRRQMEKLTGEIDKSLEGLDKILLAKFNDHLQLNSGESKNEVLKMSNVSREQRLEVLFRVARTINTIRELEPLLNKIMDLALETLNGERGFVMLYSNDSLEPQVARNLAREDILGETTISHSSALEVARGGKPMLLSRTDENIESRQSMVEFQISSLLCVPLSVKGLVLGIVYVDSRSGEIFTDDDLEFLSSFADLAAIAVDNARMSEQLEKKNIYLQKQVESIWGFGNIVGRSSPMQKVFRMAESVAETDVTVVITGDSGTGKEVLARAIHLASPRKNNRFVPVDCGAVAETLLESELFGYVKGAFTGAISDRIGLFETAQGGTILLDEISNTSQGFQAKLLRVLQESEIRRVGDNQTRAIDVRIIAATNKNLENEVKEGRFREDLYYRLNVVNICLPLLRERTEDIPLLANFFIDKICAKMKLPLKSLMPEALDHFMMYDWPGNVRQLENICERAIIFAKGDKIGLDSLPIEIRSVSQAKSRASQTGALPLTKDELKAEKNKLDKIFLIHLLEKSEGNIMQAARISGMDRSQIHHLMNRYGIEGEDFKGKA